ncbi:hypothetical protein N8I84_41845 (plasmid) [Streptomyces cynarae]|uniref:Uncharacterized protein n=1 Tax=Streptomyces cynarae TaxID=2981134 RepID=A0ABY6EDZ5_9ACTN|nr:hypothetical protein [Streptomyces cynarae]UXY24979.1 hypothetical protein N8I84_41845 [Streptomyces cynarae]
MTSMTLRARAETRPPLPMRPTPHERDGRQGGAGIGRPHPQQQMTARRSAADLARVESEIGPRWPGAIYQNVDGAFEVLALIRDPNRARRLLGRGSAQWVLIVKDVLRPGAEPFAIGSVWTASDYLVREGKAAATSAVGGMH